MSADGINSRGPLPPRNSWRRFRALGGEDPQKLVADALLATRSAHHADTRPILAARPTSIGNSATGHQALLTVLDASTDRDALAAESLPKFEAADPPFNPFSRASPDELEGGMPKPKAPACRQAVAAAARRREGTAVLGWAG
ncbi:MAG TPA: hypothetical protein PKK06_10000 [Phycisphaerae bacterium]|nr:hypothetical protein [Phycisphaerae bacterium]HNU45641.1 hypothetical protein [Phycisphaerae bacterium]